MDQKENVPPRGKVRLPEIDEREWLTVEEIAELYGVGTESVRHYVRSGKFGKKGIQFIGRQYRIQKDVVCEFLRRSELLASNRIKG